MSAIPAPRARLVYEPRLSSSRKLLPEQRVHFPAGRGREILRRAFEGLAEADLLEQAAKYRIEHRHRALRPVAHETERAGAIEDDAENRAFRQQAGIHRARRGLTH